MKGRTTTSTLSGPETCPALQFLASPATMPGFDTATMSQYRMQPYSSSEPSRAEIDATKGSLLLEFGSNGCGICRATQPLLVEALQDRQALPHIRVEDGRGRPLGRSFRIKLWPTLIFMKNGEEVARLVRPESAEAIRAALTQI